MKIDHIGVGHDSATMSAIISTVFPYYGYAGIYVMTPNKAGVSLLILGLVWCWNPFSQQRCVIVQAITQCLNSPICN